MPCPAPPIKPALKTPASIDIAEYLEGEEISTVKHEYLGGTVHAMAGATNRHNAGLEAVIPLPEIEAELPLADLYERAGLGG